MSIGMKRGTVYLEPHQTAWEQSAAAVIAELNAALSGLDAEIQHIGSTAVRTIRAKPIIDIAAAVADPDAVRARDTALAEYGIRFRFEERPHHLLYVKGDFAADTRTHHIHIMQKGAEEWKRCVLLRDWLNANPHAAAEYEAVKMCLAARYPNDRNAYTEGKSEIIARLLAEAERGEHKDETD